MTNSDLLRIAKDFANGKTLYAKGCFGQQCNKTILNAKRAQYPEWYNSTCTVNKSQTWYEYLSTFAGKGYALFDCVCLYKGILWGAQCNPYIAPVYKSNGVKDSAISTIRKALKNTCSPYDAKAGMLIISDNDGHLGIACGDGKVVECAPSLGRVAITDLSYQPNWRYCGESADVTYLASAASASEPAKDNTICVGDAVKIKKGAKAGGLLSTTRGKKLQQWCYEKTMYVTKIATHLGRKEALCSEILTWIDCDELIKQ